MESAGCHPEPPSASLIQPAQAKDATNANQTERVAKAYPSPRRVAVASERGHEQRTEQEAVAVLVADRCLPTEIGRACARPALDCRCDGNVHELWTGLHEQRVVTALGRIEIEVW